MPTKEYFEKLRELNNEHGFSFDQLDKYFWVCGKIRKGSLSLLIKNRDEYIKILKELELYRSTKEEIREKWKKLNMDSDKKRSDSNKFDDLIKEKIEKLNINEIKNPKLELIKKLFDKANLKK